VVQRVEQVMIQAHGDLGHPVRWLEQGPVAIGSGAQQGRSGFLLGRLQSPVLGPVRIELALK
jgi:hypothetical protein